MDDINLPRLLQLVPLVGAVGYLSWRVVLNRLQRSGLPLPPGPPGRPLIGNVSDLPVQYEWLTYDSWCKTYGDVVHVNALGQPIVILGSVQAVTDLLERRGAIYSDRPKCEMLQLSNFLWVFSSQRYGEAWRVRRRIFHTYAHQGVAPQYRPVQLQTVRLYLNQLINKPNEFMKLTRVLFAASIMKMVYGLDTDWEKDEYLDLVEDALTSLGTVVIPGKFFVEFLPAMKIIPDWFPFAGFKRIAARIRTQATEIIEQPFMAVKRAAAGTDFSSTMLSRMLDNMTETSTSEDLARIKQVAALGYLAGSETTVSATLTFILAMVMHPDIQTKAQAEIDSVVGDTRLPDFADLPNLPYIQAVILETFRWKPVTNLGMPHASMEDDEYRGYLIPKGSIVMPNVWSILHDPEVYPDPMEFKPERFLQRNAAGRFEINTSVRDPRTACFGFGRRICPGRHIAEQSLFAAVVSVLWAFDLLPRKDATGAPVYPTGKMHSGVVSHPAAFDCEIVPRSESRAQLVRDSIAEDH